MAVYRKTEVQPISNLLGLKNVWQREIPLAPPVTWLTPNWFHGMVSSWVVMATHRSTAKGTVCLHICIQLSTSLCEDGTFYCKALQSLLFISCQNNSSYLIESCVFHRPTRRLLRASFLFHCLQLIFSPLAG